MSQQYGPRIPRVPHIFSGIKSNKKCYKPMVVSIGLAEEARRCYDEDGLVELDDMTEFTKIMFLDGCFVIQFMHCLLHDHGNLKMTSHVTALGARDILVLENQLPFLVLEPLMNLRFGDEVGMKLIKDFIKHIRAMPRQRDSCRKRISKFFRKTILLGALNTPKDTAMEDYYAISNLRSSLQQRMIIAGASQPVTTMSETHLSEIRVDPLINKEEVLIQNNQPQELQMDETLGNSSSRNNERSLWLGSIMREVTEDENNQPLWPKINIMK
ncbi:hypothetical protein DKX38_023659 [Salix brachista]|uniref:Uncharacterized protein n=1 Tax=Salix brachista TaxID=2182728 RepID=A0A5N5JPI0_9ROSI|nr:hypothetical protein DKX38_023659 [Salix brachista]